MRIVEKKDGRKVEQFKITLISCNIKKFTVLFYAMFNFFFCIFLGRFCKISWQKFKPQRDMV